MGSISMLRSFGKILLPCARTNDSMLIVFSRSTTDLAHLQDGPPRNPRNGLGIDRRHKIVGGDGSGSSEIQSHLKSPCSCSPRYL